MKKYKTERVTHSVTAKITEVEVERETESSIWINGNRLQKVTQWDTYWDSWEEAHAHLLAAAENHCVYARRRLEEANGKLGNVKGMKKP